MQRILNHNSTLETRYIMRRIAPMHQTFFLKKHIKTTLENIGDDIPKLRDSGMMTDNIDYTEKYQKKLEVLQLNYDMNESILEEQSIELESLREQLNETQRKLASEIAQRIYLENEIEEIKNATPNSTAVEPVNENINEELNNLRREAHYYHCRMEQEKQLSRQLLTQIEAMKLSRKPVEVEVEVEPSHENILSRACIVCTERHAYYEPMPCDHPICTECYVHWFASRMQYNDTRREGEPPVVFGCPLCRTPITYQTD